MLLLQMYQMYQMHQMYTQLSWGHMHTLDLRVIVLSVSSLFAFDRSLWWLCKELNQNWHLHLIRGKTYFLRNKTKQNKSPTPLFGYVIFLRNCLTLHHLPRYACWYSSQMKACLRQCEDGWWSRVTAAIFMQGRLLKGFI